MCEPLDVDIEFIIPVVDNEYVGYMRMMREALDAEMKSLLIPANLVLEGEVNRGTRDEVFLP